MQEEAGSSRDSRRSYVSKRGTVTLNERETVYTADYEHVFGGHNAMPKQQNQQSNVGEISTFRHLPGPVPGKPSPRFALNDIPDPE